MAFDSGQISFVRLQVEGNLLGKAPLAADQSLLDKLAERKFTESSIGAPDETEYGWTAGDHLYDTQFNYEKNSFGDMMLMSMRVDTNKPPADVKRAYKIMNEQALAANNPSGFASKNQRREAAELATRQLHEDLAAGKYRRSKIVPVLWDLRRAWVYCGATSNAAIENLTKLFKLTFDATLTPITSGSFAGNWLHAKGRGRDYEDMRPSAFTPPPPQARRDMDEMDAVNTDIKIPHIPWATTGVDLKDFLGNEFLIWLWHIQETDEGVIEVETSGGKAGYAFVLTKALDMQCAWDATGRMGLRSDGPTRLPESAEALAEGKWPRKVGMILTDLQDSDAQFELSFQGDQLQISGVKIPSIEDAETPRDIVERRLLVVRSLSDMVDTLYSQFLDQRTSTGWSSKRESIRDWIKQRRRPAAPVTVKASEAAVQAES